MTIKWITKKLLKIAGITLGTLIVLLVAFHFWLKAHAKDLLENLVESKSHGKLKLKVEKFKFGYLSKNMELEKAVFYTTDTLTGPIAYRFSVDKIELKVQALLPIIFKKQILIDSLLLIDPDILVTQLKEADKSDKKKNVASLPEEMGRVYKSIQEALKLLQVKRFEINNARFTLANKFDPGQQSVTITNLFFHIDNFQVDSTSSTGKRKFLFGDNIVLRTRNQNILFPDGRHRLSFSRFRINERKKLVEFDSCTVAATKGDSSAASFNVFFDALLMTNIDFDTLYRHDVIKADSVYCVNPRFDLTVELKKKNGNNRAVPKLDKIIQQLTGDMQLNFVIVNNASFNIITINNGKPNSFSSDHNNFEMQGLSVDKEASRPLKIKSFIMAIRNYENFLRDSSYAMQFDSILFNNERIYLSNFNLKQLKSGKTINSFSVPSFELKGLSWEDLLFNHHFKAEKATLYYPLINYSVAENGPQRKKQNMFDALNRISRIMEMDELNIVDGQIDLALKGNTQLQLIDASLSFKSRSLFSSRKISSLQNSINQLQFKNGVIKTPDLNIELSNVNYINDDNRLLADKIQFNNRQKTIAAILQNAIIKELVIDDSTGNIQLSSLQWKQGDLKFISQPVDQNKKTLTSVIDLKNIRGNNTTINTTIGENQVTTLLKNISSDSVLIEPGKKIKPKNLFAEGKNLKVAGKNLMFKIGDYRIADNKNSLLQNVSYTSYKTGDSVELNIPLITLIPGIDALLNDSIKLSDIELSHPIARVNISQPDTVKDKQPVKLPVIEINKITARQPMISFGRSAKKGKINLEWDGSTGNDVIELTGLNTDNAGTAVLNKINFTLNHFIITDVKGKIFNSGNGKITAQLTNIKAGQKNNGQWNWSAISDFNIKDFRLNSAGKSSGQLQLDKANIDNLVINLASIDKPLELLNKSPSLKLYQITAKYDDTNNHFSLYDAAYDERVKIFSADSFIYHPVLSQDAFIANHPFQTDYLTVKSGRITASKIDIPAYFKDSVLNIQTLKMDEVLLTDFRDKRPPFHAGIIKPLPTELIKKIPFKLSIDSILLNNSNVIYSEHNEKTNEIAAVPVTRMTVRIFPVRNYNLTETDSLRIQANGYLLDSMWLRLRIRESYSDSLSGFFMTLRIRPANLLLLNPLLVPLSSVKLQSGHLDTLSMRAVGKEYFAFGEMKMYYKDLKVRFLKDGNETKKNFLKNLMTFVANSFVIKNKNISRRGRVFFIRLRDRSALNYLVKISMSGVASSVGAKGNQKIFRKYKKELRRHNLPPFDYD